MKEPINLPSRGDKRSISAMLFALPSLTVGAGIDDARVSSEFEGCCQRSKSLRLLPGYSGAGSIHAGGCLNCGWWQGEAEGERTTLPLNRDGMPGYTGVFAEEERAGGI